MIYSLHGGQKVNKKTAGRQFFILPLPFQMPTRLADGLGFESTLSSCCEDYAPKNRVPRAHVVRELRLPLNFVFKERIYDTFLHHSVKPHFAHF
jgi:hypothetical protein